MDAANIGCIRELAPDTGPGSVEALMSCARRRWLLHSLMVESVECSVVYFLLDLMVNHQPFKRLTQGWFIHPLVVAGGSLMVDSLSLSIEVTE